MTARAKRPIPPVVRARMHTGWRVHEAAHLTAWHIAALAQSRNASWYDPDRNVSRDFSCLIRQEFAA